MVSILYLHELNYSFIILPPGPSKCSPTPDQPGAFSCLISVLCLHNQHALLFLFSKYNGNPSFPTPKF